MLKSNDRVTYKPIFGFDTGFDLNETDDAWLGGGSANIEPGFYTARVVGVYEAKYASKPGPKRVVELRLLENAEGKPASGNVQDIYTLGGDKKASNFFRGFLSLVAPWSLAPQFLPPKTPDGRQLMCFNWFGPSKPDAEDGALVRVQIIVQETNDSEGKARRNARPERSTYELLEPAAWAMETLGACGIEDWSAPIDESLAPQQGVLKARLQASGTKLPGAPAAGNSGKRSTAVPRAQE